MMKFEIDKVSESIDIKNGNSYFSTVCIDINAAKAFLENPESVEEIVAGPKELLLYPGGEPDGDGVAYHVVSNTEGTKWSACSERVDGDITNWLSLSKDEFIALMEAAVKECDK